MTLPYMGLVRAGFPSPAMDHLEDRIDFNQAFISNPDATFYATCDGDSMIRACIPPGATLVIDKSKTPKSGDVIVASIDGEYTVKYFQKKGLKYFLVAANPKYSDIELKEETNFKSWGVVIAVVLDEKVLRSCML